MDQTFADIKNKKIADRMDVTCGVARANSWSSGSSSRKKAHLTPRSFPTRLRTIAHCLPHNANRRTSQRSPRDGWIYGPQLIISMLFLQLFMSVNFISVVTYTKCVG